MQSGNYAKWVDTHCRQSDVLTLNTQLDSAQLDSAQLNPAQTELLSFKT